MCDIPSETKFSQFADYVLETYVGDEFLNHVFPAVSKQGYTDHYVVAIAMLRRQSL